MSKFEPPATKPVAILTAFRSEQDLADNRAANTELVNDLQQLNLNFYPVQGMGQEDFPALFGLVQGGPAVQRRIVRGSATGRNGR